MEGWVKLHRGITSHWIWEDPVKLKWWLDIIMFANHEDKKVNIGMRIVYCKRGQCVMSLLNWGKRWKVSKHTVHNFFTLLKNDNMIATENLIKTTRITICNYDNYQDNLNAVGTEGERCGNAVETEGDITKELEKLKALKKSNTGKKSTRFIPPTIEEIKAYCLERKNNVDANRFFNFYQSKGWKVGSNNMKDWKASVRSWEERDDKSYVHPAAGYIQKTTNSTTDKRF